MPTQDTSNYRTNVSPTGYSYGGNDYRYETRTDANGNQYKADIFVGKTPTTPTSAPVSVVSGNTAANYINNTVVPTMNNANAQLTAAQLAAKEKAAADALAASKKTPATTSTPLTPEQQIASTPDAGYQWVYDRSTGAQTQVPLGSTIPSNYTTVDVTLAPAVESTTSADGNITFKRLSDGSYGKYDTTTGQYLGMSNENQFNLMKAGQSTKAAYDSALANGALLTPAQQAQIQSIKDTYARILAQQDIANQNFTGGTTVAQNLYGIGNTMMGLGAIKTSVDEGVAKIADINSRMNSDVAKMTAAFQSDNLAQLKEAYASYSANSASLQKAIDTQQANAVQQERDIRQQAATAKLQIDNDIRALQSSMAQAIGVTPAQKQALQKALENHDYNAAFAAVGNSLQNAEGWMGAYLSYSKTMDQDFPGSPKMSPVEFKNWDDTNNKTSSNGLSNAAGAGNAPFQSTIDNAVSTISGLGLSEKEAERLGRLAVSNDWPSLLQALKTRAKTSMMQAEERTEVTKAEAKINALDRMTNVLQKYQDLGGDMGFLKGKEDDIATKIGKLSVDPKYREIGTELTAAFQQYRQDMSGAAFGDAESAQYESVVPSKGKSFALNLATIQGLKNFLTSKVDGTYTAALGEGYSNLKGLVEQKKQNDPIQIERDAEQQLQYYQRTNPSKSSQLNSDIQEAERIIGRPISSSEFLQLHPEYSNKQTFNSVGGDTKIASVQIPTSSKLAYQNNNPGNLRFANQPGATQGIGGFAKFSSPEAGIAALSNQIKLDSSRGHTLASFINKYAPPSENDTNAYIASIIKMTGANKNTPLNQIDHNKLLKAIALQESSTKIS